MKTLTYRKKYVNMIRKESMKEKRNYQKK